MTKTEYKRIERASKMLKSISHPLRMSMVDLLITEKEMNVSGIQERLKLEQAVVSQHLAVLKKEGIVGVKKEGKNCYYFIQLPLLPRIIDLIKRCPEC